MKRFYLLKPIILLAVLFGYNVSANAQTVYSYSGAIVNYTVPTGVTSVSVDMAGASGGNSTLNYGGPGLGGRVRCTLVVTSGQILYVSVGGAGQNSTGGCCSPLAGGFNGGGIGGYFYGASGGGASDIRVGAQALSNRVIVAGGGGGGGYGCSGTTATGQGGAGGGLTGGNGYMCNSNSGTSYICYWGAGGTQSTGGATGTCNCGVNTAGIVGVGGTSAYSCYYGGGGGGGYYGGGGAYGGGGGGGSSYPAANGGAISNLIHNQGFYAGGNGYVSICPGPVAGTITGSATVCPGGSTTPLTDVGGTSGGIWTSSNISIATVNASTGLVTGILPGTTSISYTIVGTCASGTATYTMTVLPKPSVYNLISLGGGYCAGSSGVDVATDNSDIGTTYNLYNGTTLVPPSKPGTGSAVDFGPEPTGNYTIQAQVVSTGCTINLNNNTTIYSTPLPPVHTVTAAGTVYCAGGTGFHVNLNTSDVGVNYQLYQGTTALGVALTGTGSALDFGPMPAGTYSVAATNTTTNCVNNMSGKPVITARPLPTQYLVSTPGSSSYCAGGAGVPVNIANSALGFNYQLYDGGKAIGSPVAGTGHSIAFGNQAALGNYTVIATDTISPTFCSQTMSGGVNVNVNTLPSIYPVSVGGGGSYCLGGAGVHVYVGNTTGAGSDPGVKYRLYVTTSSGTAVLDSMTGTGGQLDFNSRTIAGNYSVVAVNASGCTSNMAGNPAITINPLPTSYTLIAPAGLSYCVGGSGVRLELNYSSAGIGYQLYQGATPVGSGLTPGINDTLDFGLLPSGTYTVHATNSTTSCNTIMSGGLTVIQNQLPKTHTVKGGGSYCAGTTGLLVTLDTSTSGVSYQLYNSSVAVGTPVTGTGLPLSFGPQTLAGPYTAIATSTAGCSANMAGSATININPAPDQFLVQGGGGYCTGTSGSDVNLFSSVSGISYQLYNGSAKIGIAKFGTGSAIDFGNQSGVGTYTVIASNTSTTCTAPMLGSATINVNPSPTAYTVMGGGNFCAGGTGADVQISYSNSGINYQLVLNGTTNIGAPVAGVSGTLDFGLQPLTGKYTVVATNAISGCPTTMFGSVNVTSSLPPTAYPVNATNAGVYCSGGTGSDISLPSSTSGVSYQLYLGSVALGTPKIGATGVPVDFGAKLTPGTYTVIGTAASTGCATTMTGSAIVTIAAVPNSYSVNGGGAYCLNGTGVDVSLNPSDPTVTYQLMYKGVPVPGASATGTGGVLDFGLQTGVGSYTIVGSDMTALHCTSNMTGSALVSTLALPAPYTVYGGGAYCIGDPAGVHVNLSGSNSGISYQLYNGTPVGLPSTGTGSAIDFGGQTGTGNYTVIATNNTTKCTDTMMASVPVSTKLLPVPQTVTGGGSYCFGSTGKNVGLITGALSVNYQLYNGSAKIGTPVTGSGGPLNFGIMTAAGTYTVTATDPATGCSNNMFGSAPVVVNSLVTPAITVTTPVLSVCDSSTVVFSTSVANQGSTPLYQWSVNTIPVAGETNSTYTGIPANGDVVSAQLTSNVACPTSPVASSEVTMTVNPKTTPSAIIVADPAGPVCAGTAVTYTAWPHNAGTSPTYSWTQGAVNSGSSVYTVLTPANGDNISVTVTSSDPCAIVNTTVQNFTASVPAPVKPTNVSLTVTPGKSIVENQLDTVKANYSNAGPNPTFEWQINSVTVPNETSNMLIRDNFSNHDSITCIVTGDGMCGGLSTSASTSLSVRSTEAVNQVTGLVSDVRVIPNPNKGTFSVKGTLGSTNDQEVSLEITNMLGQVVYSNKVMTHNGMINEQVQLNSSLANGMYILGVRSGNENSVFHFVIEQ